MACFIFFVHRRTYGRNYTKGWIWLSTFGVCVFFVSYIMLTILFKKMMEGHAISPELGAWLPCLVILPIGVFLTYKAMNDAKIMQPEVLNRIAKKVIPFLRSLRGSVGT
ncbi:MAG: LptF/LptG family permease [Saprospiraceae bacterium]|nr:LptF/LptG family permease [Saprospiraceae bacterium]